MAFDPEAVRAFERSSWDRAAPSYETSFAAATRPFIEPLLDAAGVRPGMRLLDLCCGPGFTGEAARQRGAEVVGLDFSTAMLSAARARFPAIRWEQGDAEAPPFGDASFNAIVSNFGIHHVPRPVLAMAQARRLLRPGGRFAFTIWAGRDENVAWKLVFDAIAQAGDPTASTAPPPGGGFSSGWDCLRALDATGFAQTTASPVQAVWRHRDGAGLLAALRSGTARMAAMIDAQPAAAMPAILSALETAAAPWRDDTGIAVPIACVIASGIRP